MLYLQLISNCAKFSMISFQIAIYVNKSILIGLHWNAITTQPQDLESEFSTGVRLSEEKIIFEYIINNLFNHL